MAIQRVLTRPQGPFASAALSAASRAAATAARLPQPVAASADICAARASAVNRSHAMRSECNFSAASTVFTAQVYTELRFQAAPMEGASLGDGGLMSRAHRRAAHSGMAGAAARGARTPTAPRTAAVGTGAHSQLSSSDIGADVSCPGLAGSLSRADAGQGPAGAPSDTPGRLLLLRRKMSACVGIAAPCSAALALPCLCGPRTRMESG